MSHADRPDGPRRYAVTGGSSGLGAAVVDAVCDRGDHALVVDRHPPRREVEHAIVDLSDTARAEDELRRALGSGSLAGLVCAAGIDVCGRFEDVARDEWERVVTVDLLGVAASIRAAIPNLRAGGGGRIVTVASTLAERAVSDASAYCAAKAGVVAMSRVLALELAPDIGVTTLTPGGMDTNFFDGRVEQYRPGPGDVMNDPRRVAAAILFALDQPPGCEVRELTICPIEESSWP